MEAQLESIDIEPEHVVTRYVCVKIFMRCVLVGVLRVEEHKYVGDDGSCVETKIFFLEGGGGGESLSFSSFSDDIFFNLKGPSPFFCLLLFFIGKK